MFVKSLVVLMGVFFYPAISESIPVHDCLFFAKDQCRLSNVKLIRTQPHFQPAINQPSINQSSLPSDIKMVMVQMSVIPIWTEDVCKYFTALDNITAANNQVEEIESNAFNNCTKLTSIDFAFNHIKRLHLNTFWPLKNLNTLYLYNNNLTEFAPELVKGLTKLENLGLMSNYIKDIDEVGLGMELPSLKNIWLNDNDFRCDRAMKIAYNLEEDGTTFTTYIASLRKRSYRTRKVSDIICLSEVQWLHEITQPLHQKYLQSEASVSARLEMFDNKNQHQFENHDFRIDMILETLSNISMKNLENSKRTSMTLFNISVQNSDSSERILKLEESTKTLRILLVTGIVCFLVFTILLIAAFLLYLNRVTKHRGKLNLSDDNMQGEIRMQLSSQCETS